MNKQIKNVIFDFSDTLVHFGAKDWFADLVGNKERGYGMHKTIHGSECWYQSDKGLITPKELEKALYKLFPVSVHPLISRYLSEWTDYYTVNDGIPELISELKQKGYKIFLLSDFPQCFEKLWDRFDFLKMFDGRVVSYEEHTTKKDMQLFDVILEKYSLKASECVFIDDLESLVENARNKGIYGIQYKNTADLRKKLGI